MKHCLLICLLLTSFNSYAALHKWVDSEGKVHYSDSAAPPNVQSQTLRQSAPPAAVSDSAVPAPKTEAEREADRKRAQKEKSDAAEKSARQQEETAIKKNYCNNARSNLAGMENNSRIVTYDAKGERIYLDDDARQQRIDEARKLISKNCN